MNKIYAFFQQHKWLLVTIVVVTFVLSIWWGIQCSLEENIFKLLPQTETREDTPSLAFTNIKLKDKIFVQTVIVDEGALPASPKGGEMSKAEAVDEAEMFDAAEVMAEAMDLFMEKAVEYDSANGAIQDVLAAIDPMEIPAMAEYVMQHGPAYIDFTEEEMDSLCSVEHIRQQIRLYSEALETETGSYLMDVMSYDPCGISMKGLGKVMNKRASETSGVSDASGNSANEASAGLMEKLSAADEGSGSSRFQHSHLFTDGGKACIGFITPTFGTDNSKLASKMLRQLDKAREEVETAMDEQLAEQGVTGKKVKVMYHGTVVMSGGNSLRIKKDMARTIAISITLIVLLLAIALKRPTYWALLLTPIVYSIFLSLATIYLVRGWMSLMALGLGAIVLGVALSYCLHVLVHYVYTGDAEQTVRDQKKPVLMGSLTTIGAFAGLLFTSSSLLQDFGAFALVTIVGTTLFSLIVIPQFLPHKNNGNRHAFAFFEKINGYHIDKNKTICALTMVWVIVCISFSGKYEFDSNLRDINYVTAETQAAMDSWNEKMNGGLNQQYYASIAPSMEEALLQLPAMERVVDSLREAGVVKNQIAVSSMFPSLQKQAERNEAWHAYFTEEKQAEVWRNIEKAATLEDQMTADFFEPFQMLMAETEEPEQLIDAGLVPDEILGNFVETIGNTTLVYFPIKTTVEDSKAVKDILTQVPGCMVLDPYYYSTNLVELIHTDFNKIMIISSLFVLVLLLVVYRNIWIALIVFMPMTLSWYTVLGAMALFHQPFNLINIVVSAFVFGIGVDYSIFIMDGLIKEKHDTMVSHKTAITLSATALVVCMFSLTFAVHPAINSISFAALVGMITTLMLSYTIEPNLYRLYRYVHAKRIARKKRK